MLSQLCSLFVLGCIVEFTLDFSFFVKETLISLYMLFVMTDYGKKIQKIQKSQKVQLEMIIGEAPKYEIAHRPTVLG